MMLTKLLLAVALSVCAVGLSNSQSCSKEGTKVLNECGDTCYCNNGQLQCCRVRKEFTSMTEDERTLYVDAVRIASTDPTYRDDYKALITLHEKLFHEGIHDQEQFLPWHRWFTLQYENLLRRVDCRVTITYWDWSLVSGDPWNTDKGRVWYDGPSGLGGDGVPPSLCIQDGVFREDLWNKTNGQCLRRRFNGFTPDAVDVFLVMEQPATIDGFKSFEVGLRVDLHNEVHCQIDGDMCEITAAEAPEFFLHHGFIDRIWSDWQNRGPDYLTIFFANLTDPMEGTEYSPRDFIDNRNLPNVESPEGKTCISYEAPLVPVYQEVWKLLRGKTRQQILKVRRHPLKPLTDRQMRFFQVSPEEQRKAKEILQGLEPRFKLKATASLFGEDRSLGFKLASLRPTNGRKRSFIKRKKTLLNE